MHSGLTNIMDRAVCGDRQAQDELIERFYPRVRQIVHRELALDFRKHHAWILPLFSTQDIVQGVFAEVVRGLEGCSFESEAVFVRYLSTIVRHRLLDAVRFHEASRRDARRRIDVAEAGGGEPGRAVSDASPQLAASLAEQVAVLRQVMQEIPERHRALLEMRLVDDEPFAAIAAKLGYASEETARQAMHEAHAKLLVKLRARGIRPNGETTD